MAKGCVLRFPSDHAVKWDWTPAWTCAPSGLILCYLGPPSLLAKFHCPASAGSSFAWTKGLVPALEVLTATPALTPHSPSGQGSLPRDGGDGVGRIRPPSAHTLPVLSGSWSSPTDTGSL